MVLYIIGLGLGDEKDITMKGYQYVKDSDFVFLESYTSTLLVEKRILEKFYNKKIEESYRITVEENSKEMLEKAKNYNVAFLVVGDPFCATTHAQLYLEARRMEITVEIVHNASIISAVSVCGLQLYRFGEIVSIPFFENNWMPESFYDKIRKNKINKLHTLCLLDIKVKEKSMENLLRGREIYDEPKFMTVNVALQQLFKIEENRLEDVITKSTLGFGLARIGSASQKIVSGTLEELLFEDFGSPLHSLVICGSDMHELEKEFFDLYRMKNKE